MADIVRQLDTSDPAVAKTNEDGEEVFTITLDGTDNLIPETRYKLEIAPISGNKRGEPTFIEVDMPKMGKSRIIDLNEVTDTSVLWKITKPDGADGIELKVYSYPGRGEAVGDVEEIKDGSTEIQYRTFNLQPNMQYKIIVKPYRNRTNGQLFYGDETDQLRVRNLLFALFELTNHNTRICYMIL